MIIFQEKYLLKLHLLDWLLRLGPLSSVLLDADLVVVVVVVLVVVVVVVVVVVGGGAGGTQHLTWDGCSGQSPLCATPGRRQAYNLNS